MKSHLAPRRIPVQSRSRERVERILDAAAQVFADAGYDAATTEAIAARAGVSIGSLYQFFPNKQSLFDAVARRHLEQASAVFFTAFAADSPDVPWQELLDRAIDAFAALDRDDPNLRAVWRNWHVAGEFFAAGEVLNREFARRAEAVLAREASRLPKAKRALVATMIVETVSAMLALVSRRRVDDGDAVVAETKVMLRRYLEAYADPPRRRRK
jgi:AcrR family transcriptional regulator